MDEELEEGRREPPRLAGGAQAGIAVSLAYIPRALLRGYKILNI